jgi:hypothetical protein
MGWPQVPVVGATATQPGSSTDLTARNSTSALPPKADSSRTSGHVRKVPQPEIVNPLRGTGIGVAGSANSRVIGSVAFVNQARAAFIVTPDEDDDTRMLLIPSKMNIAPIRHGLAYRIEGCMVEFEGTEILTSRVMYESTPITISADQALAALDGNSENRSEKSEAIDFLTDALRGGPVSAKDMKKEAADAGISSKSLRSAREALGIKPEKAGFEGGWVWGLPKMPSEVEDAREL